MSARLVEKRSGRIGIASVTRVLPTPDDPSQGTFVLNRLNAMARLAHVEVVQPVPSFPIVKAAPTWAHAREGNITRVPMFYFPGILKSLDSGWLARAVEPTVTALYREGMVDTIDAHFGYPDGVACVSIGRRLDVPVFVTLRGVENEQFSQRGIGRQLLAALNQATGCICVSHFLADVAIRHGVDEERVTVIQNSIDRSLFYPGAPQRTREQLGLPLDRPVVISVGHLVPRKRHHVLIEAFAGSKVRREGGHLAILGSLSHDRQYVDSVESLIKERGLEGAVQLVGNRKPEEIGDYLRAADMFVLLSAREGCCNALLEALACGLPVVATDVGDNRYFINESVGRLVKVDDFGDASNALDEVFFGTRPDSRAIADTLPPGDWNRVATEVMSFINCKTAR